MPYLHTDLHTAQSPKRPGAPCGDVVECHRNLEGTTVLLCDGLGSGVKAHLAARFVAARLMAKVRRSASLRHAFDQLVHTMEENRGADLPWAAFAVARIRPNGDLSALGYEAPPPVLIGKRQAMVLEGRTLTVEHALAWEANGNLEPGEALMLVSDGVTQAGIGAGAPDGWTARGVAKEVTRLLARGTAPDAIAGEIHRAARERWGRAGDDITATLAACRKGLVVKMLTGPPSQRGRDRDTVRALLEGDAFRIVCGATTAQIVARETGRQVRVEQHPTSTIAPPNYEIDGIDLVTEGAVCMTQLLNVMSEDREPEFEEVSGVSDLYDILMAADSIRIVIGAAANPASESTTFRQQGILSRRQSVPLLAERLRAMGKLVNVHYA